jgi:hypothetical protein
MLLFDGRFSSLQTAFTVTAVKTHERVEVQLHFPNLGYEHDPGMFTIRMTWHFQGHLYGRAYGLLGRGAMQYGRLRSTLLS